ncbi:MAG: zinc dependent phospholipase C family protein [Bacteroidota bacterium]
MRQLPLSSASLLAAAFLLLLSSSAWVEDWGFFGHRRINRLAVFTLPIDLIPMYKHHIEYLTEHSVDPDKRRYATKHEAVRHYIDLDHWGQYPFDNVPRTWSKTLQKYTEFYVRTETGDTLQLVDYQQTRQTEETIVWKGPALRSLFGRDSLLLDADWYGRFFYHNVISQYYEEHWSIAADSLRKVLERERLPPAIQEIWAVDRFSEYGILPYHLVRMQRRLTEAFFQQNGPRILQLSAEIGHYLGDAHVPLHTTENYNGQLTNQLGIHAFWESRIPELFADEEFDYFVGRAEYISQPVDYYWGIVLESHGYVDSLLQIEQRLRRSFPEDQQFCYEERNGRTVRMECRQFAEAYHRALGDQVERRMRGAIHAVGSVWYTCWVDAGQPKVSEIFDLEPTSWEPLPTRPIMREEDKKNVRPHQ